MSEKPSSNGSLHAPPLDPVLLYAGDVMHQRMKPLGHRFSYSVFSLLVDLDRLDSAAIRSRLFSVDRFNLLSFHPSDHSGRKDVSLRVYVNGLLAEAGVVVPAARILLVCYPRILGWVFNPLAVYYAYDASDTLVALIYEVRNTFGDRHTYVCPISPGQVSDAGVRQECDKIFHVSPFMPMAMRYRFRMVPPGESIRWRILETDAEGPVLSATFSGRAQPLTTANILRLVGRIPHLTLKIVAGIHWEAAKLWWKGARYISRPEPPAPTSVWTDDHRCDEPAHRRFSPQPTPHPKTCSPAE
ncbi:DUF1365 domain-containing protein [Rhizobium sp. NFR03]|uniref:DUF1365 domain-containing protein n=1 Tax=Rhizobium sp. NFR03 TaxID=1566263 RepID=UPI0008B11C1A|nr:DUF1365 domain-containing protein [Rhizobium sp. NFR03]SES05984.1 hypothetical protein SAMN03159406_01981 [Rhizobium sp. NFR03]